VPPSYGVGRPRTQSPNLTDMEPVLVGRMREFGTTVFTVMSRLAVEHDAVNLGQGFPDQDGPAPVLAAAVAAIEAGENQYPPLFGAPVLRAAIAAHQERFYGLAVDPDEEVLVTAGATEAMAVTLLALCEPGDEVVLIQPSYDAYAAAVAMAGATRRTVSLAFPGLELDVDALRAAVGPRTRAIVLNSPHNPTGKVFSPAELAAIGAVALAAGCWVICDEVYEHLTYDVPHVPLAALARTDPTLAGLAERVLTISSAGKTFSVTGWKVGWLTGPAAAVAAVAAVKQYLSFTGGAPFQPAVAVGLGQPDDAYAELTASLRRRRDLLAEGLAAVGLAPLGGQGTYFLLADAGPVGGGGAEAFCRELPARVGVAAIPVSAFCDDPSVAPGLVRFAYCKREDVLREGIRRLGALRAEA
jgi:N-succinyldiaminopimelate aminotransferase